MGFLKWTAFINVFVIVAYMQTLIIKGIIEEKEYKKTHVPCAYTDGVCTVRVTHNNCSGGIPEYTCERILNEKF